MPGRPGLSVPTPPAWPLTIPAPTSERPTSDTVSEVTSDKVPEASPPSPVRREAGRRRCARRAVVALHRSNVPLTGWVSLMESTTQR